MRAVTIIAATLLGIACVLYRKRACIGCTLIDAGTWMLPDCEIPDDELEAAFVEAVADYCARQHSGYDGRVMP